jgi:ubiquitin-conjugating enzyme E2 R
MSGETAAERWSPAQRSESVLLSIISLLDDAECSSPANVDAGVMLRKNPEKYKNVVKEAVEVSKQDIPAGFVMPTHESTSMKVEKEDDRDFWVDSDGEDDFGGSDTDADFSDIEYDEPPDRESENEDDDDMPEVRYIEYADNQDD